VVPDSPALRAAGYEFPAQFILKAFRGVRIAAAGLLCLCALAACAGGSNTSSDHSSDYEDGYSAGCFNGKIGAGFEEPYTEPDPKRYGIDAQYTEGWKAGYTECFERFDRFPPMGDKRM
jgi:hypothetical protein